MQAHHFAEALFLAAQGKQEDEQIRLIERLWSLLKEKGCEKLAPAIVREFEKITLARQHSSTCTITVSRASDLETFAAPIKKDIEIISAQSLPQRVMVDETLVGGYEVRAYGLCIDKTYKRSLLQLYSTLLTHNV